MLLCYHSQPSGSTYTLVLMVHTISRILLPWSLLTPVPGIYRLYRLLYSGIYRLQRLFTFRWKSDIHSPTVIRKGSLSAVQCTMCYLGSTFSFQPNKLRHLLKFMFWYTIEHIFVPACSVGRKTWKKLFSWFSNSKFVISGLFFPILSAPKIMFPVPENKKRDKF